MNKQIPKLTQEEVSKFWSNVKIKGDDECWEWQGTRHSKGYGVFHILYAGDYIAYMSNRVAWFLHNKKQPGDFLVCHTCDNPPCCNPKHFFLGTSADNQKDATNKGRKPSLFLAGEKHKMAKLTESDIKEIRQMKELGYSQTFISEKYKVSQSQISRILLGRRWR